MTTQHIPKINWFKRIGWLVLIWGGSIGALAVVALIFRVIMHLIGMTS
ncbi:DUF2474 domain-containing protein [Bartonella tamiae]|uniref:DUF2474 domain-containing protein n=1 Tax=Bartonella tamiae Th239 TaxID=1094558 RepID=J0R4A9_9HYPH|nr:DUF2474 domain-containing protein [Bartonella tamiae]EJF90474.1 hypothetical protein ME5_00875 [Bartonella tamiae Th239]EJF93582.1 hypothetical protein MEG_01006 [Bartonella tamiae Th307]